jgi:prepilin-type N-terminal cleavage/methylation domain-containing protein
MSMNARPIPQSHAVRGFTLVELMVALVVGLIVVLAATAFVVSVAKANSENIQVTRLTQELRSLSEVMGRELRRARYVADPVGLIGTGGTPNHDVITLSAGGDCIVFGYDEPPDPPSPAVAVSRSIRLSGTNILLNPNGADCTGGNVINSPQVQITALQFVQNVASPSRYDITLTGRLTTPPPGSALDGLTRTFRQTVYVRSGQVD